MNKKEFRDWCDRTGYITTNDWNYQIVCGRDYYFIINPKTDKFALISFDGKNIDYQVVVSGWTDFNGYAERFHEETAGVWK